MKSMRYSYGICMDCRDDDKVFKVRWPQEKEKMVTHLQKEHGYDLSEQEIKELEDEAS